MTRKADPLAVYKLGFVHVDRGAALVAYSDGVLEREDGKSEIFGLDRLVTLMTIQFKEYQLGSYKPRENASFESPFSATYVKQVINGEEMLLLDYLANIYRVGGVDQLAKYRANLGLS